MGWGSLELDYKPFTLMLTYLIILPFKGTLPLLLEPPDTCLMNASMLSGYSTIYLVGLGPGQIRFMN